MASTSTKCSLNKRVACILKALYYLDKKQRKALLKSADKTIIKGICECILNVISGNLKISEHSKKQLSKYKNFLRKLVKPKKETSWQQRKRILVQKGSGILPLLIQPVLSILLSKLLEKHNG